MELAGLDAGARGYRDEFTGATIDVVDGALRAAQLFERLPVALLTQ